MSARKKPSKAIAQQPVAQTTSLPADYAHFLNSLKKEIRSARLRAVFAVNRKQILLYWRLGKQILAKEKAAGWGAKVVERLAADLRSEFPDMTGLSARNLRYMKTLAKLHADDVILQEVLAKLSWYHLTTLMDKVDNGNQRIWYARQTIENGWSRNVLVHQIESGLYSRQGKSISNFSQTLPSPQSDLSQQLFKDPYTFDFLNLGKEFSERELERALIDRIRDFMLEMGRGFAFVGSQHHLEVAGEDFYLDLLFYHLQLRCFVVIDLKIGKFIPEFAGKMNFYLSAVDDLMRHDGDQPSIGLILCKDKNRVIAEYAMRDLNKPMSVTEYRLRAELPEALRGMLPDPEEIERRLSTSPEDERRD